MTVTRQETTTAPDAARAGETGARRLALALRRIGRYVRALRAFSFPLSAGPVLAAAAIVAPPADWRADVLIASLAGVVLLHAAGNLLNDYFDFRHGTDARRTGDAGRPGRLLVTGRLRPREVLAEAVACLVAAGGAAAWLAWRVARAGGVPAAGVLSGFAVLAAGAAYAYTGPPAALKRRALGEVLVGVLFGPALMLGAAYVQVGPWRAGGPAAFFAGADAVAVLVLSLPVGLVVAAVLLAGNIRDVDEDRAAGVRTLAAALGPRRARRLYAALATAATGIPAGLAALGGAPRVLLGAPLLLVLLATPFGAMRRGRRLPDADALTARFAAALIAAIALACALAPRAP